MTDEILQEILVAIQSNQIITYDYNVKLDTLIDYLQHINNMHSVCMYILLPMILLVGFLWWFFRQFLYKKY